MEHHEFDQEAPVARKIVCGKLWRVYVLVGVVVIGAVGAFAAVQLTAGSAPAPSVNTNGPADPSLSFTEPAPETAANHPNNGSLPCSNSSLPSASTSLPCSNYSLPSANTSSPAYSQYTPNPADWSTFYTKPMTVSSITDHTPDGVGWLSSSAWVPWDGTVYDPRTMSKWSFYKKICPRIDTIRGLRDVFYAHNPFADIYHPTKAEVDEWHRISLNHLRALIGYTGPDREVYKDHCMFARALWGQQRRFSTMWDTKYPSGNCQGSTNAHCGATFIPDAADQVPYLPPGHAPCTTGAGSEGVSGAPKSNIPWSIKWVRAFCTFLQNEGYWGGHVGPWFHREKFGFSFWDNNPSNNNNNAVHRGKWKGKLRTNLYPKP